jgi:hypothetical protein
MESKFTDVDITFKARGELFAFVKVFYSAEKKHCTLKLQKVLFGDFQQFELPVESFFGLVKFMDKCIIALPESSASRTGTQYSLEIQSGENAMSLHWRSETPGEGWNDVYTFKDKLLELRDKYLV